MGSLKNRDFITGSWVHLTCAYIAGHAAHRDSIFGTGTGAKETNIDIFYHLNKGHKLECFIFYYLTSDKLINV